MPTRVAEMLPQIIARDSHQRPNPPRSFLSPPFSPSPPTNTPPSFPSKQSCRSICCQTLAPQWGPHALRRLSQRLKVRAMFVLSFLPSPTFCPLPPLPPPFRLSLPSLLLLWRHRPPCCWAPASRQRHPACMWWHRAALYCIALHCIMYPLLIFR